MLLALIGPLGLPELLIILFILVLIFGAKRLSGLGRGLGEGIKGFKHEMKDLREEVDRDKTDRADPYAADARRPEPSHDRQAR
jgi:sec-independent protein translocase protein TatA